MKSITIQGVKREDLGKVATRNLRNAEQVPCVVYGSGEPIHFSADEKAFKSLVYTPDAHTATIELADGAKIQAILQDIQFHPVTDKILHVDFYQLNEDKPVTMEVPVRLVGRARGLVAGGVLRFNMRKLKVRAIPANLPDEIEIDITPMRIGHKMYVETLKNDNYTFAHPDNAVVVAIRTSRNAVKDADQDEDED
ncbi:50S ribosomal protein L25/general stress protein Ctc [Empedobacter falsenii]|jgi:large subunit ribosomal protein L25|uniref:Large ribosomal subunit protein bL25 n=1 Tax=Empedobacter falsenii TaxID=343874 RepID=A0A376J8L5_9FLAO|nr:MULTISPECIES: 50S ribosomal protein L25/general stress protein Ctc [Empedobacter]HAR73286.1 50S ribosomal protein L25 [Flavobacteriaceae bacterium]MBW1618603.1 50S ribosomal protein L25/general stress protein Ctc [Empedobacter falsenii]MBY0066585.1 50S ribosomal protein L25/general stress protein Ctc [Empedobacter falsenii]MDH0659828.1 50S ribosomal protein L25/general stress protein Ctc [Empedobacter sp. GD03865]MDH0673120.1 50S ribosomal protein L25/general stress protein Ctc [Empedobacte